MLFTILGENAVSKQPGNIQTISFVVVLCVFCSFILATLSSVLRPTQEKSEILDRSKQMLRAAKIFDPKGYFLIKNEDGEYAPAKFDASNKQLVKGSGEDLASAEEILTVYNQRIVPVLINQEGKITTFEDAGVNYDNYLEDHRKTGYANLDYKLAYRVLPNGGDLQAQAEAYVIPVVGFGLWDAIYGYIGIQDDGNTVVGISWYEHKETPGLGANISDPSWQKHFPGKKIFVPSPSGETNFQSGPMGITVLRGKVEETLGDSPKAISAVDGMAGATLTGNGVSKAYKDTLTPYRDFFIHLKENNVQ